MNIALLTFFAAITLSNQQQKINKLPESEITNFKHFQNLKPIIIKNNNLKITYEKTPMIIQK